MPTPSEQLLTRTVYGTDGVTTNWDFAFSGGYLDKNHVKAYTEASTGERTEIIVTEAMLVGPYQVRIAPALAAGLILTVYRDTPKDLPLVDFTDESGFSEIALDTNARQAVFIAAETTDTVNTSSSYDAEQAASLAATSATAAQVSANSALASALTAANEADASAASAVLSAGSAVDSANSAASSSSAATAVFNANTTAYTRTLLDDTDAAAARTTLAITPANIGAAVAGPLATSGITGVAASGANTDITSLGSLVSINGGQLAGLRNLLINGNLAINQRAYVSGTATGAANQYTLDRWRVVTSGQSLTFTASGNGNSMTAPAGGVEQVIEGANIGGGTYVLGWTGTATASVNGTARTKGESFTLPANTNATVRLIGGTASLVQLEPGGTVTPFEQRPYGMELAMCQRYYFQALTQVYTGANPQTYCFKSTMRAVPTVSGGGAGFSTTTLSEQSVVISQTATGSQTLVFSAEL